MPGKWPSTPDRKCSPASVSPCASPAPPENRFWPSCGQRKRDACSTCGLCCCARSARSPLPARVPHWCRPRRHSEDMQPKRRVRSWHRTVPAGTACPLECASTAPPENRFWRSGMQPQQQPCMSERSGAPPSSMPTTCDPSSSRAATAFSGALESNCICVARNLKHQLLLWAPLLMRARCTQP